MDSRKSTALGLRRDNSAHIQKPESGVDRLAVLKARVAAATGTSKAKGHPNPAIEGLSSNTSFTKAGESSDNHAQRHTQRHTQPLAPRAVRGSPIISQSFGQNRQRGEESNPYFDEALAKQTAGSKQREPRRLVFNQKGKYIQQANALRRQAALEAMKKRIAEQTRRAGINEDLDVEKNFVVDAPPDIEWWDEALVDGSSYSDIESTDKSKIHAQDSIVTEYIQHPVALEPPQDRHMPEAKAMFLTTREQAKIRRQRRMAELKEMQAKIRLGLVPAPPPKVKKANLMRVLGDVAVKDPTAVEARVNREIAERHQKHVSTNEDRKLSKEQKHEKLSKNQQKDASRGIHILYVYSAWAPQFAEKLRLSATESNLVGQFGNLGMYSLGVPVGILVDQRGPRPFVLVGAILLVMGYFPLHLAYQSASGPIAALCVFSFLSGLGSCMAFAAAVKTSALNWPSHRGTATAFPLAAFGLSAFFFSTLGALFFPGDPSAFLKLLCWGTFGLILLGFFSLRVSPHPSYQSISSREEQMPSSPSSNLPSPPLQSRSLENGFFEDHPTSSTGSAGMRAASPPTLPRSSSRTPVVDAEDGSIDETSSLMSSTVLETVQDVVTVSVVRDRPHRIDIRGLELLRSRSFWFLFSIMAILSGIGLMTIK
ncbi:hypothetical protein UVI_02063890 [Ustilaginoidea virens]|uniref:Pre-mRNA-splicing factor 3 domain-containing protein n=1 Tax=Ustilaginoidea virens TaxID=1159556 RepID=A0A1B5L9G0_USTVR|nr:hypothetical protein UVI_02063890 [Ustilaginoidea virens]